jgi:hypothetical protein
MERMRQGQQNRRGRGRNNGQHRKGGHQNPLTRSFESTGPDTKIRGTPAHIAEKYMALARDALSSGDPVLAENYLQHAEHYNRIIMAYREQAQQNGDVMNGGAPPMGGRFRQEGSAGDDFSGGEGDEGEGSQMSGQPAFGQGEPQPQPRSFDGPRFEERGPQQGPEGFRGHRPQHHHRDRDRSGGDSQRFSYERQDRDRGERRDRFDRGDRQERGDRGEPRLDRQPSNEGGGEAQRRHGRDRGPSPTHEQPEFLRRPVRRPRSAGEGDTPSPPSDEPTQD